jgi:hypothetical protein
MLAAQEARHGCGTKGGSRRERRSWCFRAVAQTISFDGRFSTVLGHAGPDLSYERLAFASSPDLYQFGLGEMPTLLFSTMCGLIEARQSPG